MAIENLQALTYGVISVAFAIGTCSIFLRLYCRLRRETFGRDDVVAIILLFVNGMQQTILYIFLHHGCGLHYDLLSLHQREQITKWLFIEEIFYMFVHWTIKQAFLLFYLRLSPDRPFQIKVYGTMVLSTLIMIANWLLAFLQCRPLEAIFHPADYPNAQCMSTYVVMMVPTGLNVVTDIIVLTLPIPTVLRLQMSNRRKMAVLGIMGFGGLSVVTALCPFDVQRQVIANADTTYVLGRMIIVAAIEIEIAVVAVNLPALRSLFTDLVGSSTEDSTNGSHRLSGYIEQGSHAGLQKHEARLSRTNLPAHKLLGANLTGSEEELLRQAASKSNITVTTNEDVASERANSEYMAELGFAPIVSQNLKDHVEAL
ncbi:uncharacterized protein BP01DRAFT_393681 [Aspergillus saccharolyticus JOP 1030-1]|uniref:Rhodopsin domain-containing protein n=1 Tax=Aspergillus saccharolyticus JOP 1030-1 TaxID=1450539 RepID=A0A318ZHE8_9EURO|nr:hypothetical protein BP01DRAFT_393681 [Aspergillus saccharolyticus JOP 1030-1]PYH43110.1 hypothetical protein BP01DRAFT_393681 [Aspergillus saccharolyticus JOP 1030-1]